ncbi:hypothetical protein KVF89_22310 [Nocardioides carbamazepini]|uniref:hypothetical protein n=1 Tax=Nocardioides carbamazepini TaxID=2854259 RepID=UPI00214A5110|nr:hypothetical protein [Nocardioides carbamazepini]MCR1785290.1 hypothetical protein [Nocardioides carbamazepini]
MSTKILTPTVRRWIYGIAVAAAAVLTFYGVIPIEAAPLWLALVMALLNVPSDD